MYILESPAVSRLWEQFAWRDQYRFIIVDSKEALVAESLKARHHVIVIDEDFIMDCQCALDQHLMHVLELHGPALILIEKRRYLLESWPQGKVFPFDFSRNRRYVQDVLHGLAFDYRPPATGRPQLSGGNKEPTSGKKAGISRSEAVLLHILHENAGETVCREQLLQAVCPKRSQHNNLNSIDKHVSNLRKKLPELKHRIRSVKGEGYIMETTTATQGNIEIRPIALDQALPIRKKVLWPHKPLDYCLLPEDGQGIHLGLFQQDTLTSIVSLYWEGKQMQFRKFATLPEFQGFGFGTKLLMFAIGWASTNHATRIWCNARENKQVFYARFGLQPTGDSFARENVRYIIMERIFSPGDHARANGVPVSQGRQA